MASLSPETIVLIQGYFNIVTECAIDPAKAERYLKYPEKNQEEIVGDLRAKGFTIPDNAFVAYDEHAMTSKITLFRKDNTDQILTMERNLMVESFLNYVDDDFTKIQYKKELAMISVDIKEVLDKYQIFIVLPYLLVSAVKFNFNNKEEIVLSTC